MSAYDLPHGTRVVVRECGRDIRTTIDLYAGPRHALDRLGSICVAGWPGRAGPVSVPVTDVTAIDGAL